MNTKKLIAAALCIALCVSLTGCIFDFSALPEFPRASKMNPEPTPATQLSPAPAETAQPGPTPEPEPEPQTEPTPEEETYIEPPEPMGGWLMGVWYGWWIITGADGDYEPFAGRWSDVLMDAQFQADDTMELTLVDEEDRLGRITVSALNEELFVSESGSFFGTDIGKGTWQLSRNAYGCEDFMVIKDLVVSTEEGSFTYSVYLKPWGSLWDDVAETAQSIEGFYSDMLPYRYADYLKMLDNMQTVPENFKNFG